MAEEQSQGFWPFLEVHQEVRRLFQELVHQSWGRQEPLPAKSWQPCCDMVETDEAILVEVELPGVTREDIYLRVESDLLSITGERRAATEQQERN